MVAKKTWKQSVDTKDSKITALTTKLNELEKRSQSSNNNQIGSGGSGGIGGSGGSSKRFDIPEWRLTKTLGPTVEKDGHTWHWCSKQHNEGKGMYVTHKEVDHVAWIPKSEKGDKTSTSTTSTNQSDKSLTLSNTLKAAMVTKFKCSKDEATKLWADCCKESQQGN
jgi:hypothetical protein